MATKTKAKKAKKEELDLITKSKIIKIYEFIRAHAKPTTLIDLYIELIELDKHDMRSSLQVLIDDGYIVKQIVDGDEAFEAIDRKRKFDNKDISAMKVYIHTNMKGKDFSKVIDKYPSVMSMADRDFNDYSKLGQFYTLIGYIGKHYKKRLPMKTYWQIFKNHRFLRQSEYKKLKLSDLFYEKNGVVQYSSKAPKHFYKPLVIRNNVFDINRVMNTNNTKFFYPKEDKITYINNDAAIQKFLRPYLPLIKKA